MGFIGKKTYFYIIPNGLTMRLKDFFLYHIVLISLINTAVAQQQQPSPPCSGAGQTPATAFPVCGSKTFFQQSVPICGNLLVPGPPCTNQDDGIHLDMNPYWYKFTCYTAGTLGFVITPNVISDDYDWQLFDITNRAPADVFLVKTLFVCMNWSGEGGLTGASSAGTVANACGGRGQPTFSSMPTLIQGHQYLLLVSHFADTQSGYTLEFKGGTADITDPTMPAFVSTSYNCGPMTVGVKLSRRLLCSTLASDGSDFAFTTAGPQIIGATGVGCNGFDTDSVLLTLNAPLPNGDYTIITQTGTDGNTMESPCGNALPVGQTHSFHIGPPPVVVLKSDVDAGCAPDVIKIALNNLVRCESIRPDGSDFQVTGTSPVSIISATGNCNVNNLADTLILRLNKAITEDGDYTISLVSGTVLGECHQPVSNGQQVSFHTADTVNANFTYSLNKNCKLYTFTLDHDGAHNVNSWKWSFDDGQTFVLQHLDKVYDDSYGDKQLQLIVSNGLCSDTSTISVFLEKTLEAAFEVDPGPYCPLDIVTAGNKSFGNINSWTWEYGNGNVTNGETPVPQQYFPVNKEQYFNIRLIVTDDLNCRDTANHEIMAVTSCYIDVPTAFTPNNDGVNDFLYPLSAYKATDLYFSVYNRLGQLVFESNDWQKKWNGTVKGLPADLGAYVWMLSYTRKDTGKKVFRKGTVTLIR